MFVEASIGSTLRYLTNLVLVSWLSTIFVIRFCDPPKVAGNDIPDHLTMLDCLLKVE
jgi:hypothetical protein